MYKQYIRCWLAFLTGLAGCLQSSAQTNTPSTSVGQVPAGSATVNTVPGAYTTGALVNYVRLWAPQQPYPTDATVQAATSPAQVQRSTQYFDGLGRQLQTVNWEASPAPAPAVNVPGNDIISPVVYDGFSREQYKYLPYTDPTNDGQFKASPFADQSTFYATTYPANQPAYKGENFYYSHVDYEPSPLNRIIKTFAPGNSWAGSEGSTSEKSTQVQYLTNIANEVQVWSITSNAVTYASAAPYEPTNSNAPTTTTATTYAAGQLIKTVTIDEAGNATVEYKDFDGHVVLKKVQVNSSIAANYSGYTGFLSTYYVYDNLGLLRFVIPPKATTWLAANGWSFGATGGAQVVSELCFWYEYDSYLRLINKKVPGKGCEYIVYDTRDRPVFTQDDNMRQSNQWLRTIYDALNRPVETDMVTITSVNGQPANFANVQSYVTGATTASTSQTVTGTTQPSIQPNLYVNNREIGRPLYQASSSITIDNGFTSETNASFTAQIVNGNAGTFTSAVTINDFALPTGATAVPLLLKYYDNYSNTTKAYDVTNNSKLTKGSNAYNDPLPTAQSAMVTGMVTSTRVRIIENATNLSLGGWLETAMFYDDKGRAVQIQSDNYKGGLDKVTSMYNFIGKPVCTYQVHNNAAGNQTNLRVQTNMYYDYAGRLLTTQKNINDDANAAAVTTTQRTISQYSYDLMGQLMEKKVGQKTVTQSAPTSTPLEDDAYAYNIRGWLKGINWSYPGSGGNPTSTTVSATGNKWFGMDLSYDWGFNTNQYNGNIAGQQWANAGDQATRAYGYGYDAANRLLYANFNQYFNGTWAQTDPNNSKFTVNFNVAMGTFTNGTSNNDAYDENGNILRMQQYGFAVGSSALLLDDLTYTYLPGTNKLQNVRDAQNNPQTLLGDFKTSTLHPQYTAKQAATTNAALLAITDYSYDNNGNLTQDLNKDIATAGTVNGIVYNYLNLPYQVTIKNKGTIIYIYDAAGNKIEKRVNEAASAANNNTAIQTTTTYLGVFVYQNNVLQYFGMEEGRIRPVAATTYNNSTLFAYDYVLKDHLGNTRVVLTDELQQDVYVKLDFEGTSNTDQRVINQSAVWDNSAGQAINVLGVRIPQTTVAGFGNSTSNGNYISSVANNAFATPIGAAKLLKVMAGDQLNVSLDWEYSSSSVSNSAPNGLGTLLNSLAGMVTGSPDVGAALKGQAATIAANVQSAPGVGIFFTPELTPNSGGSLPPMAYLHVLLFSDQFVFDATNSYVQQIATTANHAVQTITPIVPVPKSGYAYIYFSNESATTVYFDNFNITHVRGPLLETDNYYPFGLAMAGISSQSAGKMENLHKSNGGDELQHKEFSDGSGLEAYDANFRMYDAQIGRFWQADPLADAAEDQSPYSFVDNNPVSFSDALGLTDSTKTTTAPGFPNSTTGANNLAPVTVTTTAKPSSPTLGFLPGAPPNSVPGVPGLQIPPPDPGGTVMPTQAPPPVELLAADLPIVEVPSLVSTVGAGGLTLLFSMIPLSAGETHTYMPPGFPKPKDQLEDFPLVLYRGVYLNHPDFENAKLGIATPKGGDATPEQHAGGNYNSIYTSWTMFRTVADYHANKNGAGGIVLKKVFRMKQVLPNFNAMGDEGEYLVPGVVTGAQVLTPNWPGHPYGY